MVCFIVSGQEFMNAIGTAGEDESGTTITKGPTGDLFIGGYSGDEGLVLRVSPEGEKIWMQSIDFGPDPDYVMELEITSDNFIIGCGNARTGVGFNAYGFIFKMELDGTLIWSRRINCDDLYIWTNGLEEVDNGNYRMMGSYKNTRLDNYLIEYEATTGSVVWDSIYAQTTIDNAFDESYYDIVTHEDNGADYIGGRFQLAGGMGTFRPSLTKINADGHLEWSKTYIYNSSPSGGRYYCFGVDQDEDAVIMGLLCRDGATSPPFETGLIKTDLNGDFAWAKLYTSPGRDIRSYNMQTVPGGYLISGWIETGDKALFMIKADELGNVIWAKEYGGGEDEDVYLSASNSRTVVSGSTVYTVGRTASFTGSKDVLLIRADLLTGELSDDGCFDDLTIITEDLPAYQQDYPMVHERLPVTSENPTMPITSIDLEETSRLIEVESDTTVSGDTLYICDGEELDILADWNPELDFLWNTGETTQMITVNESGTYYVAISLEGGCLIYEDSVTIELDNVFFDLGPDTTICSEDSYLLAPGYIDDASYSWQDGSTEPDFLVEESGLYWLTIVSGLCTYTDSVTIDFSNIDIDLGLDSALCYGDSILLDAGNPGATYLWSDDATSQTNWIFDSGDIWVEVNNGICNDRDTINLSFSDVRVDLGNDTVLCMGSSLILDATVGPGITYTWSDGSTTPLLTIEDAGTYSVTVSDGICFHTDEIIVEFSDITADISLNPPIGCSPLEVDFTDLSSSDVGEIVSWNWQFGDAATSNLQHPEHTYTFPGTFDITLTVFNEYGCSQTMICNSCVTVEEGAIANFTMDPTGSVSPGTSVSFANQSMNETEIIWHFEDGVTSVSENPSYVFDTPGAFDIMLIAKNSSGCNDTLVQRIFVEEDILIYVPNIFTPDGDSFNEQWRVYMNGIDIYDFHLILYNRWGEIIWESYDVSKSWDGTYGGNLVQDGVYVWQLEFGEKWTDERHVMTGHVTVLK